MARRRPLGPSRHLLCTSAALAGRRLRVLLPLFVVALRGDRPLGELSRPEDRVVREEKMGCMKTLLLLRHAKSSWKDESLTDHERPLNKRGKKTAPQMGHLLRDQGLVPDLIVSSTAVRARSTAEAAGIQHIGRVSHEPRG